MLAVSVAGLTAMLIQGCKREQNNETENTPPPADTNTVRCGHESAADGSVQSAGGGHRRSSRRPPVPEAAGTEYVVVKGDTLAKIAKKNGVTLKALEAANPGVEPTKLKVGQKLTIPAGGTAPAATAALPPRPTPAWVAKLTRSNPAIR